VVFSAAEESFGYAVRELRDAFGSSLRTERLGPDLGLIAGGRPSARQVATEVGRRPLVFIRHLTVEVGRIPLGEAHDIDAVARTAVRAVVDGPVTETVAVQIWTTGAPRLGFSAGELFRRIAGELDTAGCHVASAGCKHVLSCCVTPTGVVVGLNRTADSLVDWPGGRVRLTRTDERVSRAEFKLDELDQVTSVRLPVSGRALDLGAAPGGWSRILRRRGLSVWAVDPADLDARVAADAGVHHVRTTAGEFLRGTDGTDQRFDLVVNDMRMDAIRSARLTGDAAAVLHPGGLAVVTLKLGPDKPVQTVRRCLDLIARDYDLEFARQLHHNRHEVTAVARRR
jgi:23S rRNA (cytidine2498-2'-O)-methyltransferase